MTYSWIEMGECFRSKTGGLYLRCCYGVISLDNGCGYPTIFRHDELERLDEFRDVAPVKSQVEIKVTLQ